MLAPSLDIVPRRFEEVVETGTGGSYFDWAVGPAVVEDLAKADLYFSFTNMRGEILKFGRARRDPTALQRLAIMAQVKAV